LSKNLKLIHENQSDVLFNRSPIRGFLEEEEDSFACAIRINKYLVTFYKSVATSTEIKGYLIVSSKDAGVKKKIGFAFCFLREQNQTA